MGISTAGSGPADWLDRLAMGGLAIVLAAGATLPLYTDEIAWRFHERAGYPPGLDTMLSDTCGANSLAAPPLFMMPVRLFSATINSWLDAPIFVRLQGVACALLFLAMLWRLLTTAMRGAALAGSIPVRALVIAPLGLGVLPLLMVMSRPEQPLIIGTVAAILLALRQRQCEAAEVRSSIWITVGAIVLIAAVSLSYHLKGVLYVVVLGTCLLFCSANRATLGARLAGIGATAVLSLSAFLYWSDRFRCPGDPVLAEKLARENVAAVLTGGGGLMSAIGEAARGIVPFDYILLTAPDGEPMSSWLPPGLVGEPATIGFMALIMAVWASLVAASIWNLVRFIKARKRDALKDPRVGIGLSLFAIIAVWGASQLNKNVYEAAHVLPMLAVASLLCLTLPHENPWLARWGTRAAKAFVAAGIASQAIMLATHGPALWQASRSTHYLSDQPYSVPISGYGAHKANIAKAMQKAGMPLDRRLHRPLIDDLTYLALQGSHLPIHWLGVFSDWNGSIDDPVRYLLSRKSDGVVMGCINLPVRMEQAASRAGDICALSGAQLARLGSERDELDSFFAFPP